MALNDADSIVRAIIGKPFSAALPGSLKEIMLFRVANLRCSAASGSQITVISSPCETTQEVCRAADEQQALPCLITWPSYTCMSTHG